MNSSLDQTEPVLVHRATLWDMIGIGGIGSVLVFTLAAAVFIWGIVMLFRSATARTRSVYCLAALFPLALSLVVAASGVIRVFQVIGFSEPDNGDRYLEGWAECFFPVQCALFGAALAFTVAAFAFLRKPRQTGV